MRKAIAQDIEGDLPVAYMPQRMAFDKWRVQLPQRGWGQSAISVLNALRQGPAHQEAILSRAGIPPTEPMYQAGDRYNRLPSIFARIDPALYDPNYQPLARGALPRYRTTSAVQLNRLARRQQLVAGSVQPQQGVIEPRLRVREEKYRAIIEGQQLPAVRLIGMKEESCATTLDLRISRPLVFRR